jgi:hypothetical protein
MTQEKINLKFIAKNQEIKYENVFYFCKKGAACDNFVTMAYYFTLREHKERT